MGLKPMPDVEVLGTGRLDDRDSAFPMAVQLASGDIVCSYGVGGGAHVTGGTDWSRSTDNGATWQIEGTILPKDEARNRANFRKLTRRPTAGQFTHTASGSMPISINSLERAIPELCCVGRPTAPDRGASPNPCLCPPDHWKFHTDFCHSNPDVCWLRRRHCFIRMNWAAR